MIQTKKSISVQSAILWIVLIFLFYPATQLQGQYTVDFKDLRLAAYAYKPIDTVFLKKQASSEVYAPFSINSLNGDISYFSNSTQTLTVHSYNGKKTKVYNIKNIFDSSTLKKVKLINYSFIDSNNIILIYDAKATLYFDKAILWYNLNAQKVVDEFNFEQSGVLNSIDQPLDSLVNNLSLITKLNFVFDIGQSLHFNHIDSSIILRISGSNLPFDQVNFTKKPLFIKVYPKQTRKKFEAINVCIAELCPQFANFSLNGPMGNFGLFMPHFARISESCILIGMSFSDNIIKYNIVNHVKENINTSHNISKELNIDFSDTNTTNVENSLRYLQYLKVDNEIKKYYRIIQFPDSIKTALRIPGKSNSVEIAFDSAFKPTGFEWNEKMYFTTFGNFQNMHYGHVYLADSINQQYHCIVRYQVSQLKTPILPNPKSVDDSASNSIRSYLKSVNPELLALDTIPVIFIRNVCLACLQKVTGFLQLAQYNPKTQPFILIAPDTSVLHQYLSDTKISKFGPMQVDCSNTIYNTLQFNGHFIFLVQDGDDYKVQEFKLDQLNSFLYKINPSINAAGQVCKPLKEY